MPRKFETRKEAAFTAVWQMVQLDYGSTLQAKCVFFSCLCGFMSCWLQGQPNQAAAGDAAGVVSASP